MGSEKKTTGKAKATTKGARWKETMEKKKDKKTWCKGDLWIDENGCLFVNDKDLAAELHRLYEEYGSICVSWSVPGSDGNKMNSLCNC